ncbi:helix-turn-helix domain-containing protein [Chitinophaga sp. Hz27]|uniref:helix-turn-helix domain-containing protein n=1 Tax=Chitinophaga sp. Hz27 TaxID=3347169 RepID=UPI0035DFFEAD
MLTKTKEITTCMLPAATEHFWVSDFNRLPENQLLSGKPAKLSFYLLLLVQKGKAKVVVDGHEISVTKPAVVCARPGNIFQLQLPPHAKGQLLCFAEDFFSVRYNNNVLSGFSFLERENGCHLLLTTAQYSSWKVLLDLMKREFQLHQKNADSILRSYLNILLCQLDRELSQETPVIKRNIRDEKIRQFKAMLDIHFTMHKTPSFYAAGLNITTNYLNKLCQQQEGLSSGAMIRKRITIEAQRLLHYTALPIADIARELAFEHVSYFITFFKKNTGVTPEHYRKNH